MNGIGDWNLVRSFLDVADHGSLSAASRATGVSQPTLGRHVAALQDELGVTLFARHARGLELTEQGTALYAAAHDARAQIDRMQRAAAGLSEALAGIVRVSASEVVAHFVLPSFVAELRREHPEIEVELVSTDATSNLLRRDADIAVRMVRPTQQELVARRVGAAALGLYASQGYVSENGEPSLADLSGHTVIGLDRSDLHLRALQASGADLSARDFAVRTDSQPLHLLLARAGVGIAGLQRAIAGEYDDLVPVLEGLELPQLDVWVVAHADVRRSPRVRAVFDGLAEHLRRFYAAG